MVDSVTARRVHGMGAGAAIAAILGVGLRYVALYAARVVGRVWNWFDGPLTRALLPLAVPTALVCVAFGLLDAWVVHGTSWLRPRNVAVVIAFLAFVRWLMRARTRVVVDDWDHPGPPASAPTLATP